MKRRDFLKSVSVVAGLFGLGCTSAPEGGVVWADGREEMLWTTSRFDALLDPETENRETWIHEVDWSKYMEKFLKPTFPVVPPQPHSTAHLYTTFCIKEAEYSLSLDDMKRIHFDPALMALAQQFNSGEVFQSGYFIDSLAPKTDLDGIGIKQFVSNGGRIPIRCTISYDIPRAATRVDLEIFALEQFVPKTKIVGKAPKTIDSYEAGYNKRIACQASNWETGDVVRFVNSHHMGHTYKIIEACTNWFILERPLVWPVKRGQHIILVG